MAYQCIRPGGVAYGGLVRVNGLKEQSIALLKRRLGSGNLTADLHNLSAIVVE